MKTPMSGKFRLKVLISLVAVLAVSEIAVSGAGFGAVAHGQEATGNGAVTPFQPDATILEIMDSIVMPSADVLWSAVVVNYTQDGLYEEKPETDEDWARLRWSAVSLAEATNLLLVPGRRVDHPGAVSAAPDSELGPDQIQALIDGNHSAWAARAAVLHDVALQTVNVIDAHDVDGLSEIGGAIDEACENCHLQFWYPEQR